MNDPNPQNRRRAIPPVDEVLLHPRVAELRARHPRFPWTPLVRAVLDELRTEAPSLPGDDDRSTLVTRAVDAVSDRIVALRLGGLVRVLNGTGVVLHTNLGRAPVGERTAAAALQSMTRYVGLEVDLATGERSHRGETLTQSLRWLTGAEDVLVVNNNAAAVVLVASSVSPGRVIVSRGELVEIGGSFRLPEILRHAASEVVEVGTTNRTYAADYESVAHPGDLILKVHKSNYTIEGFAHDATITELVDVARRCGARVAFDLGSGAFFDFAGAGVGADPVVPAIVASGVDAVTMSADKLPGGLQAGIIAGKASFVATLKQNPLRRAVRVDKVTVASLQEIVRAYLFDADPREEIPVLAMIEGDPERVRGRAARVAERVSAAAPARWPVSVEPDDSAVGGGSLSNAVIPSFAVTIRCASERAATRLARDLRAQSLPLFGRVRGDEVRVNMNTILPDEDDEVARALIAALAGSDGE
jgi:L-seryl-tRNA(Ser) seleniumtransferase